MFKTNSCKLYSNSFLLSVLNSIEPSFFKILQGYSNILKKNGSIEFKTDNRKLFEYSLQEFVIKKLPILDLSLNLHEDKEDIITTEYEDKFTAKGNVIYFIEVENA